MTQHKVIFTLVILLAIAIAFFGAYSLTHEAQAPGIVGGNEDQQVACTMEAKMCSDGSYVGRQGPNCEFAECPIMPTSTSPGASLQIEAETDSSPKPY